MTRDPNRIEEVLEALRDAWTMYPDMRLGQLVNNAPYFNEDGTNTGHSIPVYLVEDDRMLEGLRGVAAGGGSK